MFNVGDKVRRNILVSSDHGLFIVNRFDHTPCSIGGFLLDHGNNNTVEADITIRALKDIDAPVVFDIGANIGTYSSWVAKWAEQVNGTVYSFEPQRTVFQMFCGNMSINNIFNVHAINYALGKEEKFIDIEEVDYNQLGSFGSFSLNGASKNKYKNISNKTQRIRMSTLDKFVEEQDIQKVDFIKIDVEGLDIDVIEGGINTIMSFKPDLYVEYLNLGSSKNEDTSQEGRETLVKYLNDLNYTCYIVGHDIFATSKGTQI